MYYIDKKTKLLLLLVIVAVVSIITAINPSVNYTITAKGKLLPAEQYIIRTNGSGGIESFWINNINGQISNYSIYNFQRGDVIDFRPILNLGIVNAGDTLATIASNRFLEALNRLNIEITELEGMLQTVSTGRKPAVLREMKNRVQYAEQQIKLQQEIYDRSIKLFEKQLISAEDYEIDKGKLELYKIEAEIARQMLTSAETGAKPENIASIRSQLQTAKTLSNTLASKISRLNIISPFSGVPDRYEGNDTLLTINNLSEFVLVMPILMEELPDSTLGLDVSIELPENSTVYNTKITNINDKYFIVNGNKYLRLYAEISIVSKHIIPGGSVRCEINGGKIGLLQYLDRKIN